MIYTAYPDDTAFFLKNQKPFIEDLKVFDSFLKVSGLKPNTLKWGIAGIGGLKGIKCMYSAKGLECINLKTESSKILGILFSYSKKLKQENNFESHIVKSENVLKLWKMRDFSNKSKITRFQNISCFKYSTSWFSN